MQTGGAADIPKETRVQIWRLKALRLSSPHWKASTYRGDVIVRAQSEANARRLAAKAFGIGAGTALGREVAANPWNRPWLVAAKVLEGSQYDPDGEEEILYPLTRPSAGTDKVQQVSGTMGAKVGRPSAGR